MKHSGRFNLIRVLVLVFTLSAFPINISSQILWQANLDAAKAMALKSNKLLLIYFWSVNVSKCTTMDYQLWQTEEVKSLSKNFVCLRINTDYDKGLLTQYNVSSLPWLMLATADGERIWEKEGFEYPELHLEVIRGIPDNPGGLNPLSKTMLENKKDFKANMDLGVEFQKVGRKIKSNELKQSFLASSERYLLRAQKLTSDQEVQKEITLYTILNDVYYGRHQKALKAVEKIQDPGTEPSADLYHFVKAMCFKAAGDDSKFQAEKQKIKKEDLLLQLEN